MMKNIKIKLAAFMILLGTGAAFATQVHHRTTDQKWARNPITGAYTDITGLEKGTDYRCNSSTQVCTVTYAAGVDPASPGTATPISQELGLFQ
jgi:hypothetical protein